MKKLLALCIVFALALTLCACGQDAPAEARRPLPTEETPSLSLSP